MVEKGVWLRRVTHQSFLPSAVSEETSSFSCYKTSKLTDISPHNPHQLPNVFWHLCYRRQLPAAFPSLTCSADMGINQRNLNGSKSAELCAGREFEGCNRKVPSEVSARSHPGARVHGVVAIASPHPGARLLAV